MNSPSHAGIQQILQDAVSHHQAGRLDRAKALYEQVLRTHPKNPDALHLFGLLCFHCNDAARAKRLIKQAIAHQSAFPPYHDNLAMVCMSMDEFETALEALRTAQRLEGEQPYRCFNMGIAYERLDRQREAERAYRSAVRLNPQESDFHFNLGNLLMIAGRMEEAAASYHKALECVPIAEGAHTNLANTLIAQGRPEEAVEIYNQLLSVRPQDYDARFNLGCVYLESGREFEAIGCFQDVVRFHPEDAEARLALGRSLNLAGRYDAASREFCKVLDKSPDDAQARRGLVSALRYLEPDSFRPQLESHIISLFQAPEIHPQALARISANQLRHKYGVSGEPPRLEAELSALISRLKRDRLYLDLMACAINTDPLIEKLTISVRRFVLGRLAMPDDRDGELLDLAVALVQQCFANEYIYLCDEWEERVIDDLERNLQEICATGMSSNARTEASLICTAMYRPLAGLGYAGTLADVPPQSWSSVFRPLVEHVLLNPLEEMELQAHVPVVGDIEDAVSRSVRRQYEENPYPRWRSLHVGTRSSYGRDLNRMFPHFRPADFLNDAVIALAAGCGTGQEAAAIAGSRPDCEVIGVDLSLSSLAYATRMARELNLDNLSFYQGDILNISRLGRRFQVIECSGVLHHMADPESGWQALTECLDPGGVMKIGLYSEHASAEVTAARERIREQGIATTAKNVKDFRAGILASDPDNPLYPLRYSEDLYTLSACRDLLFHVQEQCFTLPRVERALASLGLDFIGFEHPDPGIRRRYLAHNPDDKTLTDLAGWARFEEQNPQTFAAMYVFWCCKPATSHSFG